MAEEYEYETGADVEPYSEQDIADYTDGATLEDVSEKQSAIVYQPTDAPENPNIDDVWVNTSTTPHEMWVWDGTQWNKTGATTASEVGTHTIATIDKLVNEVQLNVNAVSARTTVTEGQLADGEGLASTVTKTETYKTDVQGYAQSAVDGLTTNMNDEEWTNKNLPKMVTSSQLTQKADEIEAKFTSTGGVNMVKNSVGYSYNPVSGLLHWSIVSGSAAQYLGDDCIAAGSGIGMNDGVVTQSVQAQAGEPYTLTLRVDKGTAGSAYVKLSDGDTYQQIDFPTTVDYDFTLVQIKGFIPANNILIVELGAVGVTGGSVFTEIMLNHGVYGLLWSHANGEVYNGSVTFDINGVKVKSNVYDGYTVMSPSEFSGYYRNAQGNLQKVFTLNGATTEVANMKITDTKASLEMGSVKMVRIESVGSSGWAFIPS